MSAKGLVKLKDVRQGKTFYTVCCGEISKSFVAKGVHRGKIQIVGSMGFDDMVDDIYLQDFGIIPYSGGWYNDLNRTFHRRSDAEKFVNSPAYQEALKRHEKIKG